MPNATVKKKTAPKPKGIGFSARVGQVTALRTYYLEIPAEIVRRLGGSFKLRVHVQVEAGARAPKLPRTEYRTGLMALGQGRAYVAIKKKMLQELGLAEGDRTRVAIRKDESRFGMDMPEELAELLKQEPAARKRFDALLPGMQRYILYYVNGVKNPEKRLERAMLLIGNLLRQPDEGRVTFRKLLGKD